MREADARPNILFAIADDTSHCSAYGHGFVSTPHFDRVAREGILFNHAFTTNPKCAPSRASILPGRHTWQNRESCLHWNYWPDDLPVYPDLLEAAGYHVGFTGKGWAPGDWKRCGRERNPAGTHYNDRTLTPPAKTKISNNDYAGNFADFLAPHPEDILALREQARLHHHRAGPVPDPVGRQGPRTGDPARRFQAGRRRRTAGPGAAARQ